MPEPSFLAAAEVEPARLHRAFTDAFSDYLIGPFQVALAQWPQFLGRQGVDLASSRVALRGEEPLAFAFVAPRPGLRHWRLATMGAVPAARGSGAAPALLDDFIARAAAAGMAGVELECFAQNGRALQLYRGRGFQVLHELHGYAWPAGRAAPGDGEVEVEAAGIGLDEVFAWLDACAARRGDLPLQVTPASLRALPVPLQAWRRGSAQLVFSAGADQRLTLHSLVDEHPSQRDAQALVTALLLRHDGWAVTVPQLQRPDLGGEALLRLGFERLPLHQVMMRRAAAG